MEDLRLWRVGDATGGSTAVELSGLGAPTWSTISDGWPTSVGTVDGADATAVVEFRAWSCS